MMALKVISSNPLYLRTERELQEYLDALFTEGREANSSANVDLQVVQDFEVDSDIGNFDNVLSVGIDYDSGYGGLIWHCIDGIADRVSAVTGTDMTSHIWVSLNPTPPEVDPKVLVDPGCPSFFNRISVLPLADVRSAVEEYFHEGNGFRPKQVEWTKGNFNGEIYIEENGG
ncbi:Imm1 family immunity protein [Streptomyces sp. NPDC088341]|uniref:Imm1 family immunity protein n=1 Tax=Streptomyces sp. NPDC088341 TaxID=3154870 RepID=UPI0034497062